LVAAAYSSMSINTPISALPKGLNFTILSDEDIVKLSVVQITKTAAVDPIGQHVANGLYDNKLGATKGLVYVLTIACERERV
jgi:hypothetical protein